LTSESHIKKQVSKAESIHRNIDEPTNKALLYGHNGPKLIQGTHMKSQGLNIPSLSTNQQRLVSKSPYMNDNIKKTMKNLKPSEQLKPTKTQQQKKQENLIKASLSNLQ
jgi:hypothetical protein